MYAVTAENVKDDWFDEVKRKGHKSEQNTKGEQKIEQVQRNEDLIHRHTATKKEGWAKEQEQWKCTDFSSFQKTCRKINRTQYVHKREMGVPGNIGK